MFRRRNKETAYDMIQDRDVVRGDENLERGRKTGVTSKRPRQIMAIFIGVGISIIAAVLGALFKHGYAMFEYVMSRPVDSTFGEGFLTGFEMTEPIVTWQFVLFVLGVGLLAWAIAYQRLISEWKNENALAIDTDINTYQNDQYIMPVEMILDTFDYFPDAGAHAETQVSAMISHVMVDNKGINEVPFTQRRTKTETIQLGDGETDKVYKGEPLYNDDGTVKTKMMPFFDKQFGDELFTASGIDNNDKFSRKFYQLANRPYNPIVKQTGQRKDRERQDFDTIGDMINKSWTLPEYEVQRPAGTYLVDTRPVNTMVLAITRAGKGQTYIEPVIDMWTREARPNNIVINDPKGELLQKFYVPATVRGFEVVQFNLINPINTDIYNPLGYAAQAAREGDFTKTASYVDTIGATFFPVDGADDPMWPNAASNAFKRSTYGLIDFYLEEEKELRAKALKENMDQKVLEQKIDELWSRVTLYNAYQFFVQLSAKKSKDPAIIKIDDDDTAEEKDYLTLFFDATNKLPANSMRNLVRNADNALRAMAGSDKTIASVYGIALTGMSFFTDPTISTLTSGPLSQNFDAQGLSFPRRIGVRFSPEYIKRFKPVNTQAVWQAFADKAFTRKYLNGNYTEDIHTGKVYDPDGNVYEGKKPKDSDFTHSQIIGRDGWSRFFFDGKFPKRKVYIQMDLYNPSSKLLVKSFYFELTLTYRMSLDGKMYVKNPITNKKIIKDGVLRELRLKETQSEKGSVTREFVHEQTTLQTDYRDIDSEPGDEPEKVDVPAFSQTTVKYKEMPSIIFMITPPHLQSYAKLLLILIKQMVDVNFESSYMTKENQKPDYKTRFMLDELGNLQSEGSGISGLQTMLSIGLGQDQQFTLILQTLQQLRDVYGDSADKIIQGNAQPLTAKIATPTGWIRMGDIQMNDTVLTPDGGHANVIGIYPKGTRPVYRVTLRDGSTTLACNEHLWEIERPKTVNPKTSFNGRTYECFTEVIDTDELKLRVDKKHQIDLPHVKPLTYDIQDLSIDPYVLGVIIGDAYVNVQGVVRLTSIDEDIINEVRRRGYHIEPVLSNSTHVNNEYYIYGVNRIMRELNIAGKRSYEKLIPEQYLYGSLNQRIDLLRGLMDTDGYISKKGEIEFTTASFILAKDVQTLIRSLGGRVNINVKENVYYTSPNQLERKQGRVAYRLQNVRLQDVNPFLLECKANLYVNRRCSMGNRVVSVEYVGEEPVQCILIDDDRHLYITDDYIPTHNTNNIIFLKSTDDAMIDTLVKLSGTTHVSSVDSKTITRKEKNVINKNEGSISYNKSTTEKPVITVNDFLFIKPRQSIVFSAGDSPIWNRFHTILPMSWRLLFVNPIINPKQPKYSLQTVPTLSNAVDFDVRKNQPNFYNMLMKRVNQAREVDNSTERYRYINNYSAYDIEMLDPDVYADELMSAVNRAILNGHKKEAVPDGYNSMEDYYDALTSAGAENMVKKSEPNTEMLDVVEQNKVEENVDKMPIYANGKLSKSDFRNPHTKQVNMQLASVLANAYEVSHHAFSQDKNYQYNKETNELYDVRGNLLVASIAGSNQKIVDDLTEASHKDDSTVYAESNDLGISQRFEVTEAFVRHLVQLDTWRDIANGEFDKAVSQAYVQYTSMDDTLDADDPHNMN